MVVKFHGTFSDDASLVLTESSYFERLEFESAIDIKLRADTLGKSLLFVGYSLNDINIRYLLDKLHKLRHRVTREHQRAPSAYLLAFGAGEIQRTLLAQWDVEIIDSFLGYCDGRRVRVYVGETRGRIADRARGAYSFAWDPIFIPEGSEKTYGEMGLEGKRTTSPVEKAWEAFMRAEVPKAGPAERR
jgi:hypothetical protein